MTYRNYRPRARGTAVANAVPGAPPPGWRWGRAALTAAALGVTLVSVGATPAPAATATVTAAEPAEVLHYRLQISQPGSPMNPPQDLSLMEVWQAGDGSRVRALVERDFTRSAAEPILVGHETVLTSAESRSYSPGENRIVIYRRPTWLPAPAGYDIPAQIGDPRTLPDRAQDEDGRVKALGQATVNNIPVLRFRLGACRVARASQPGVVTIARVSVVSIHRDTHAPVRVEHPPCHTWRTRTPGLRLVDRRPGESFDYVQFESLPATESTLEQLEMSPHLGAVEVDGAAIDAAEEAIEPPDVRPVVTGSRRAARSGRPRVGRLERSHARLGLRSTR